MKRKHILIVTMDTDHTAPGVVFQALIRSLSSYAELTVLCPSWHPQDSFEGIHRVVLPHYHEHSWKTIRRRFRLFGSNFSDHNWVRKALPAAMDAIKELRFDWVVTFTSMCYFPSIVLGKELAIHLGLPWYIYSVDGIPSPAEWMDGDRKTHCSMARWLDRHCTGANTFFSANPFMMEYQKQILKSFTGKWDYLYTPHTLVQSPRAKEHSGIRFLYTGNLYGLRKVDGLADAFRQFRKNHPDARICFVGAWSHDSYDCFRDLTEEGAVVFEPYCKDLTPFYETADILIDIGADIPGDVFLSSKIISYLPQNRPILSISGIPSPVRSILAGCPGIYFASNRAEEILSAMEDCVKALPSGIKGREPFIDLFDADNVARKLYETLNG